MTGRLIVVESSFLFHLTKTNILLGAVYQTNFAALCAVWVVFRFGLDLVWVLLLFWGGRGHGFVHA